MKYLDMLLLPLRDIMERVLNFIPTLVISLAILAIGYIIAKMLAKLIVTFLRAIDFDKHSGKIGLDKVLKTGGIKDKPSSLMGCLVYWTLMVGTLIATVKSLGIVVATELLDKVLAYIPSIFAGVFVLIIGMLLAKFVSLIVFVAAKNTDMPIPDVLAKLSKWAIVLYVAVIFVKEIGFAHVFMGPHYSIFVTGIVFALALSFGLAGKDIAAKYLDVIKK